MKALTIYNASAGSGKTFTLAKTYLQAILSAESPDYFRCILAITFTNKAVAEMKTRIIENLVAFSQKEILESPSDMFSQICEESGMEPAKLQGRAQKVLEHILHNYAMVNVETIDSFNHRLIRTFAKDLKLPADFEIELEVDDVLDEAVDNLIDSAQKDDILTGTLVDYALEKSESGRSWNFTYDLRKIAKTLKNEPDRPHLKRLSDKTPADFKKLGTRLKSRLRSSREDLKTKAGSALELIGESGLEKSDFKGGYLPGFFQKIVDWNLKDLFGKRWQEDLLAGAPLYKKNTPQFVAETIDAIAPQLATYYEQIRSLVCEYRFLETVHKSVVPVSLLQRTQKAYDRLKADQNKVLISDFNLLISEEIKDQPTPFIYERIGNHYQHFFIDEFQDTSRMQWRNLFSLLDNALAAHQNKTAGLMLVGDAKQAIYRFRGGDPELFIDLCEKESPFSNKEKKVIPLDTNYRSYDEIIRFNNGFFTWLADTFEFKSEGHRKLYKDGNDQKFNKKTGGYVSISFVESENGEDTCEKYCLQVLEYVRATKARGFRAGDIAILVRSNKYGAAIAQHLTEQGEQVISDEALLLTASPAVVFLTDLLRLGLNFDDQKAKADTLYFLHAHLNIDKKKHPFIGSFLNCSEEQFCEKLAAYGIGFSFSDIAHTPLYETCEWIAGAFGLAGRATAYVQYFLDLVYDFSRDDRGGISEFLEYWDDKKHKLSISAPEQQDAVRVMTIHKAKGLEFPVVVFPFADDAIHDMTKREQLWFRLPKDGMFSGFPEMHIGYSEKIRDFEGGEEQYIRRRRDKELDSLNVLYVALTRAEEHLYVLADKKAATDGKGNPKETYAGFLYNYLNHCGIWNDNNTEFTFGSPERVSTPEVKNSNAVTKTLDSFPSSGRYASRIHIASRSALLWDSAAEAAIERGILIHELMAGITTKDDISPALEKFIRDGVIDNRQAATLENTVVEITGHPDLKSCFEPGADAKTEQEIYTPDGHSLRPDRINFFPGNKVIVTDYKTGAPHDGHKRQLGTYSTALKEMGFEVVGKKLVYIGERVSVIE